MNKILNLSRRDVLKTSALMGAGFILGFFIPSPKPLWAAPGQTTGNFSPNAFIRIGTDGGVTLIINKSEMGQGVYTSLPMLVAEELEVDWSTVRVEPAPVDPAYNHTQWGPVQGTGGSTSVRSEWDRLRQAGATAREMMIMAAAGLWRADRKECLAASGFVIHTPSQRKLSYGQLAEKAAQMSPPQNVPLKAPKDFKIIGKSMRRLDTPEKVAGKAVFGIDFQAPGLLTALIARSPVFGGKVKSFDATKAKGIPGVKEVFLIDSGVAVVAEGFWAAQQGREALEISWDEGPLAALSTPELHSQYTALAKTPGMTARKVGNSEEALARASKQLKAEYEVPYLAHACMEPMNCVVDLREESCDIWVGTQSQTADRNAAARIAGLKPEQVKIHTTFLGGGFGRRANPQSDFVSEAVQVARAVRKPVKVLWTREDDMKGGFYRPMWYDRISAGLDGKGNIVAWEHTLVGQSILAGTPYEGMVREGIDETSVEGAKDLPYQIPNVRVELHSPKTGVPVLWWRSVGHSHTAFVVESFFDEVAHAGGKDPFEFRRELLTQHPRHRRVLELAAQKAGWGRRLLKGRGRGLALHESFGSFVAQVAEVSLTPAGKVRVHRVVCAIDCGLTVNPDTIKAQMESSVVFGLSAALYGQITFKNGRVEQGNFNDYSMLHLDEMPRVDVHIVPSQEPLGGVGEPGVPPVAPAVANAVFQAVGIRVRRLPLQPEVLEALKKKGG